MHVFDVDQHGQQVRAYGSVAKVMVNDWYSRRENRTRGVSMSERFNVDMISRRQAFSLFGLAAALGVSIISYARAQTPGMERREERRDDRLERREERRDDRLDRREDRQEMRQERRDDRRGLYDDPNRSNEPFPK